MNEYLTRKQIAIGMIVLIVIAIGLGALLHEYGYIIADKYISEEQLDFNENNFISVMVMRFIDALLRY